MSNITDTTTQTKGTFSIAQTKPSIFFSNGQVKPKRLIPEEYIKEMQTMVDEFMIYKQNLKV